MTRRSNTLVYCICFNGFDERTVEKLDQLAKLTKYYETGVDVIVWHSQNKASLASHERRLAAAANLFMSVSLLDPEFAWTVSHLRKHQALLARLQYISNGNPLPNHHNNSILAYQTVTDMLSQGIEICSGDDLFGFIGHRIARNLELIYQNHEPVRKTIAMQMEDIFSQPLKGRQPKKWSIGEALSRVTKPIDLPYSDDGTE